MKFQESDIASRKHKLRKTDHKKWTKRNVRYLYSKRNGPKEMLNENEVQDWDPFGLEQELLQCVVRRQEGHKAAEG